MSEEPNDNLPSWEHLVALYVMSTGLLGGQAPPFLPLRFSIFAEAAMWLTVLVLTLSVCFRFFAGRDRVGFIQYFWLVALGAQATFVLLRTWPRLFQ